MAGHIFISYSRDDAEYVAKLVEYLQAQGLTLWVDTNIDLGDRWNPVVRVQLEGCVAVVAVMTPYSEASEWVERELQFAQSLGKPIVPLLLAGKPFFSLFNVQHDNVVGGRMPSAEFVTRLRILTRAAPIPAPPTTDAKPPVVFRGRVGVLDCIRCMLTPLIFYVPVFSVLMLLILITVRDSPARYVIGLAIVLAVASLGQSAVFLWATAKDRTLTVSSAGLAVGEGKPRTYPWREFIKAEIVRGRLVAVTGPDSWLGARADLKEQHNARLGGFVVASVRSVRATAQQIEEAIDRFAPSPSMSERPPTPADGGAGAPNQPAS